MKKSTHIQLVLITAALASCQQPKNEWESSNKVHVRGDSTAPYSTVRHHSGGSSSMMWYYAFRPYGNYYNGQYRHAGYYSNAIRPHSNIGSNSFKSNVVRGGFGHSSYSVGS